VASYATMEKEMYALLLSVDNYRDYLEAAPLTYVLTDSQPVCWAIKFKNDKLKLSRWLVKLYEFNINFIVTHVSGDKNGVADFLSRLYYVHEDKNDKKEKDNTFGPKTAMHIKSPFSPFSVLTKDDIISGFEADAVVPCSAPDLCHLNVNNFLYKNLGPFVPSYTCLDEAQSNKKILTVENFSFTPNSLEKFLTLENILKEQLLDPDLSKIYEALENGDGKNGKYLIKKGILCKTFVNDYRPDGIVVPKKLVPYVLTSYHFQSHAGPDKLLNLIQLKYYWRNMFEDVLEFAQGCVLCQMYKSSNQGPNEVGTPRPVLEPTQCWQIDVCSGLNSVNGSKSFLNMVDMYTGYTLAVPLKGETSNDIAKILDETTEVEKKFFNNFVCIL
jgi:hypothetical protein